MGSEWAPAPIAMESWPFDDVEVPKATLFSPVAFATAPTAVEFSADSLAAPLAKLE